MNLRSIKNEVPKNILDLCYYSKDENDVPVFPYVVAVTGHRNISGASDSNVSGFDEPTLKNAFKEELEDVAAKWNKTSKGVAPLVLLTGMADGADQIAAEAALEIDPQFNVKVVAVLPMKREIFRLTVENKERFDRLLNAVHYSFALPIKSDADEKEVEAALKDVDNPETEIFRQRQYARLADFLAVHSHILFAFWDGIDDGKIGGTASVVRLKLQGSDVGNQGDFLTRSSIGPVVQLLTPRAADHNEPFDPTLTFDKPPFFLWTHKELRRSKGGGRLFPIRSMMTEARRLKGRLSEEPRIADVLEKLGQINADAAQYHATLKNEKYQKAELELWGDKNNSEDNLDVGTRILFHHYLVADQLAELFQRKSQNIGKWFGKDQTNNQEKKKYQIHGYSFWVAMFAFFAGILSLLGKIPRDLWDESGAYDWNYPMLIWLVCILYWVTAVVIAALVWKARLDKFHYRYFRSRAVAEALRVQIFWRVAGINDCVSNYYRSHQTDDSEWLRSAINGIDIFLSAPKPSDFRNKIEDRLTFVRDFWIDGQLKYLGDGVQNRRENDSRQWWETTLFTIALFFVVTIIGPLQDLLFSLSYCVCDDRTLFLRLYAIGTGFYCVVIPTVAACLLYHAIKKRLLYRSQEADRFERTIFSYERAVVLTNRTEKRLTLNLNKNVDETVEYWRQIFRQLGAEAIEENADWLLTVGERNLTLPR